MATDTVVHIQTADRVRDGLLVTFSDGIVVLFSTSFLIASRDRNENLRILDDEEG